ncbi:spore coat U domain-containing protein [Pseudomonas sp. FYR_2]|uniref:Spore coat protein U domain-containing protein n=2 Tax=Pseudomonas TaxID=286 RepID=A0A6G6UH00_9PSED|nr:MULTISPECIES: spore coat U domain-containing protein [Pseudomonas]MBA6138083.1 spore coat protein U domain-containing protein [Pseudomonas monteilii]MBV4516922.1 spore coat U domain-containing protein [Pseudomonas kurunegalensis]MBZ3665417.1 spore coat protein U domain-containing protein [Pseudomonas monteilii]MBZ3670761.1 spore coat protein U domain-containing protein [Pseudomonas monteilii]MCA4079109.1 spore coat U domain-containing protein [Pseudomonas kurunegalensis]
MRTNLSCCMLAGLGLALASPAQAATVTGSITSTLTLIAACQVNGGTATSGLNFGALNFGTVDALFTSANAQVQRSGGGAMSILCSAGAIPVIKVRAGLHDGQSSGGTRALADGAGNFVPYDLYTDSGASNLLAIDGTITLPTSTGAAQTVNLYGRAVGKAGLPPGTYTDTISVELSF